MILSGSELAAFIKQRHYTQVRALRPKPHLAIIQVGKNPASASFIRAKIRYGQDIGVGVEHIQISRTTTMELARQIKSVGKRSDVHGIVVQLPLSSDIDVDTIIAAIDPRKDIDGLGQGSLFEPGTPTAIMWLLGSYDISLKDKQVVVIGQGRLVGRPMARLLEAAGASVTTGDDTTPDLASLTLGADIIITATGQPGLIQRPMVAADTVIIDAGTALAGDKNRRRCRSGALR